MERERLMRGACLACVSLCKSRRRYFMGNRTPNPQPQQGGPRAKVWLNLNHTRRGHHGGGPPIASVCCSASPPTLPSQMAKASTSGTCVHAAHKVTRCDWKAPSNEGVITKRDGSNRSAFLNCRLQLIWGIFLLLSFFLFFFS